VLRRTSNGEKPSRVLDFDGLQIDGQRRAVTLGEHPVSLTAREFDILYHLASHPSQVFARERLVASLWGDDFEGDASTVTVHVHRLREKIEADPSRPRHIKTVWGAGYCFEP
jgi:two-component system response regulator ResD